MKVIVSMLNFNGAKESMECLASLMKIDRSGIDLMTVVVDNGSNEPLDVEEKDYKEIGLKLIVNKINKGFSGGHNTAYEYAKEMGFDFFVPLNNDVLVDKDFLKELLIPFDKDNEIGLTVPKIYFTKGYEYHKDKYEKGETGKVFWYAGGFMDWDNVRSVHRGVDEVDSGQYDREEEVGFATGACMAIKKEVLDKTGLFDENYFLYYEDADLNMKIKNGGYKIIYVPTSIIWHNNAGSSGSGSTLHDYYITRNRMYFGMKFAPLKMKILLIKESMRLLVSGRQWQKAGIRDFYLHRLGKGSFKR